MAEIIVAQRMWQRRDTAANWTAANPVLAAGEIGVELSTPPRIKVGDGVTAWNSLAYAASAVLDASGGTTFDVGFRDIPQVIRNANATFALSDRGKHWIKTDTGAYTWTIPPNSSVAFPVGTALVVVNDGASGAVTVARGSGVALLNSTTDANQTIAAGDARTLLKVGTDRWRVL